MQGKLVFVKKKNNKQIQKLNGSLSHSTETALKKYFKTLNGHKPNDLYQLVLKEMERPLMKEVMNYHLKKEYIYMALLEQEKLILLQKYYKN